MYKVGRRKSQEKNKLSEMKRASSRNLLSRRIARPSNRESPRRCAASPPASIVESRPRRFILRGMSDQPGRTGRLEEAAREIEAEVKRVLEFVEERIVPRARRDGEKMLRRLAEELNHWADHLHDKPPGGPSSKEERK
jgi:hypothetical protein